MKGYKMLNNDMTSRYGNMTYEIGKTYKLEKRLIMCYSGYHFCEELTQCYLYYPNRNCEKRFFEIETEGNLIKYSEKCATDEITLVREIPLEEVFDYIRENKNKVNWEYVSRYQKLSEDFIREFKDRVDWLNVSIYQDLTEDFIREFEDKVEWSCISRFQRLTENFIREFKDRFDWYCISEYQHLSKEFKKEFQDRLC